jgi:hypothetical protein
MVMAGSIFTAAFCLSIKKQHSLTRPVASKVLTPGGVGWRWLEKVVDSKRMTPATERNADEQKDS